jgi:hypothetical protein
MSTSCQRRSGDGCALLRDARTGRGMLGGGGITPTSPDGSDSPAECQINFSCDVRCPCNNGEFLFKQIKRIPTLACFHYVFRPILYHGRHSAAVSGIMMS